MPFAGSQEKNPQKDRKETDFSEIYVDAFGLIVFPGNVHIAIIHRASFFIHAYN
jgi:hypothetical protein